MYLPLTGFKEKDSAEERMSIDSIGPSFDPQLIQAVDKGAKTQQDTQKVEAPTKQSEDKPQGLSEEQKKAAVDSFYCAGALSTQDFLILRTQSADETYKVLDQVIADMKENIEEVGDAIEAMSKMVKKTSKENIALQVLQKTFEAIDEARGDDK